MYRKISASTQASGALFFLSFDLLSAAIQFCQYKIIVAQDFGAGQTSVDGVRHHFHGAIRGAVQVVFEGQQAGQVYIDVFVHSFDRQRVGRHFDDRQDRVPDDVALPGGEQMQSRSGGAAQRHHFGGGAGRIHEVQTRAFGFFGLIQIADHFAASHFFDIAKGFFFNGREPAANIAFGGL